SLPMLEEFVHPGRGPPQALLCGDSTPRRISTCPCVYTAAVFPARPTRHASSANAANLRQQPYRIAQTMNAPPAKPIFAWEDPLLLEEQLTEEERMVRNSARAYAQDKLMPRVLQAHRQEHF